MEVESYFENHKGVIAKELEKARKSVFVAVAWINFKEYFDIFKSVLANSANLKIVCSDNWQNRSHQAVIDDLISKGAEIKLLKMPRQTNHMHHKFAIIDSTTILNGSFNWSPNATSSFENILVIKENLAVTTEFINEFEKLFTMESQHLKELQGTKRCKEDGCKGELYTLLIFSEHATKYHELYGDIIEICNSCESHRIVKQCVSDNALEFLLMAYRESEDDYENELIDRSINNTLNKYTAIDTVIHAIGRVKSGLMGKNDDFIETRIIWKNKFVGNKIPDVYDDNYFDVWYDN